MLEMTIYVISIVQPISCTIGVGQGDVVGVFSGELAVNYDVGSGATVEVFSGGKTQPHRRAGQRVPIDVLEGRLSFRGCGLRKR
jgi:hypothetical protein